MNGGGPARGLSLAEPGTWLVLALSGVFVLLGLLFLAAPRVGAALFGLPPPEGAALAYLPAIGLRDLAFGMYLFALVRLAGPPAVAGVLAITVLIPAGDILLVARERGLESPGHLSLHALSGLTLAAAAAWVLRQAGRNAREERS